MNISIIAFGTRSDIQPLHTLGKALKNNGYFVRMIAGSNFKGSIEGHGPEAAVSYVDVRTSERRGDDCDKVARRYPVVMPHLANQSFGVGVWNYLVSGQVQSRMKN